MSNRQEPAYRTVMSHIRSKIDDGTFPPGSKMPTVRSLAEDFDTSPTTVQRAFQGLEHDGYLDSEPSGMVVSYLRGSIEAEPTTWKAFWSYSRRDDELSRGRISRLIQSVRDGFELETGEVLGDFKDTENISWGDNWRQVIERNLRETVLFIPILSPGYLRRPSCLKEFRTAYATLKGAGLERSICPIVFVDITKAVRDFPDNEIAAILEETQYHDFSRSRALDEDSSEYQMAVNKIVDDIKERAVGLEDAQRRLDEHIASIGDDDAEGILDRVSKLEECPERIASIAVQIGDDMKAIGSLAEKNTKRINDLGQREAIKGRVAIVNRMAHDLDGPADELVQHCSEFMKEIAEFDEGVSAFFELMAISQRQEEDDDSQVASFLDGIEMLQQSAKGMYENVENFDGSISTIENIARAMRKPAKKMRSAAAMILSTKSTVAGWGKEIG
ncbi:MAG: GntR family transcriptional regulator [Atopobiaceae bacterium]|nr:GntR family transcriptional regulator [Atopobiaceae bacterium]